MARLLGICILMICFMTSFGCTLKTVDTIETGVVARTIADKIMIIINSEKKN